MHALYTAEYFPKYLDFSIGIFHRQYPKGTDYKGHEDWEQFLYFLKTAQVSKIIICSGMLIGSISQSYFCCPITENSPSEESVREKYFVVEEIIM